MKWAVTVFVIFAVFCFPIVASADAPEDFISDFSSLIPEGTLDGVGDGEALAEAVGFERILSEIYGILAENGGRLAAFFSLLIGLALLCALAGTLDGGLAHTVRSAVLAVSAVAIFESISDLVGVAVEALSETSSFFGGLIPIMTAVTASGGGVSAASVSAAGMSLTLGIVGGLTDGILGSLVSAMFALGLISELGGGSCAGLFKSAKGIYTFAVGLLTFLLGATLSLQTVIATATDGMMIRGAKYTVSGLVPIVGGTVSGALSTLASGLAYAKSFIGVGGVAIIVTIALAPTVLMLAYRVALSLAVDFLGYLDTGGGVKCFSSMLGALDCLIATYALSTVVYIFEIILFIKSGVGIL